MQKKNTLVAEANATRWSSYSALAQSLRKTHSKQELLKAAAKGALSVALPLAIVTLPTKTVRAQALCSATSYPLTSIPSSYGFFFDINQDGTDDLFVGYFYQTSNFRQLLAIPINGALIAASVGVYFPYAYNLNNGATIPGTLSATTSSAVLYSTYNGVGYGNFQPGVSPSGNIAIQTANGEVGWIGLTVTAVNGYTITFIGFEGQAPESDGGMDGFGTAVIGDCSTLPVELAYFKAQASKSTIQLAWATESETNNAGFQIERSKDGKHFYKIGFVKGHDTTIEAHEYAFEDKNIFANTTYYYRLKQVDNDGSFAYSEVQTVILKNEKEIQVSDLFPNPATTYAQLQINTALEGTAIIELFNSTGQQLRQSQQGVQAGTNTLELTVADLPKGTYFAKVQIGEQTVYKKLVIAK